MAFLNISLSKKLLLGLCIVVFCLDSSNGQNTNSKSGNFWDQVQFGGGVGLNFGDGFFSGSLAPAAIYRFNPTVGVGVGLNAIYSKQKNVFKSTVLGGSVIGLFNPVREIQVSTEFEQLYVNRNFDERFVSNIDDEYWYPAIFMGIGYVSRNITFGIRYDLLYDENKSIYNNAWMPFVRVFF